MASTSWLFSYIYLDDRTLVFTTDYESRFPPPPRAEESFALLKQIGAKHLTKPTPENFGIVDDTADAEYLDSIILDLLTTLQYLADLPLNEKRKLIRGNRDCIDLLWNSIEEDRTILQQLTEFDAIGDLSSVNNFGFTELAPRPYRRLSRIHRFKALLLFADGQTEDAIDLLIGFLETNRKLMPHTRHVITGLTCIAADSILNATIKELKEGFSANRSLTSRVSEALKINYDPIPIIEQWVLSDLIALANHYSSLGNQGRNKFGVPNVMPYDCVNQMARFFDEHMELLKSASIESALEQAKDFKESMEGFHLRNSMGRKFFSSSTITPANFLDTFQKHEERTLELIASLSD